MSLKEFLKSKKPLIAGLFLLVYVVYFSFGLHHITKFTTADETIWWIYDRVPKYWDSLLAGKLEGTFINDKPGVSVAIISGIGYNLNKESFRERVEMRVGSPNGYKRHEQYDANIEKNLFALRLPLLIFNGIFALFLFWLIKKIADDFWIPFWSFTFMLLSPILLGISQIINPDTLLWSFSAGTIFSFLAYLKTEKKSFAFYSSLCLGMAILSKYTATIFFPFFIIISLAFIAYKIKDWREKNEAIDKKIRTISIASIAIIFGSILVYAIGMPAVFKIKGLLLQGTVGFPGMKYFLWPLITLQVLLILESFFFKNRFSLLFFNYSGKLLERYSRLIYLVLMATFIVALIQMMSHMKIFNIGDIRFDSESTKKFLSFPVYKRAVFEVRPLVFSLSPLVLALLLFYWGKMLIKKTFNFTIFTLSLFLVVFYSAVIFQELLVTIRYSIVLYPLVMVLAAFGLRELHKKSILKKINPFVISIFLILISISSLWFSKPFYFNYTNFLLPQKYMITGAWGYGGYEAAKYLNSLPGAENLTVWADYPGVCDFIKGKCYITNAIKNETIDYFVLTRRGQINYANKGDNTKARPYYKKTNPVWELIIHSRPGNYVRIYKNETKQ